MTDNQPTAEQIEARRKLGFWLLILGIGLLLFGLYISAFLVPDVISAASGPESMTLAEAAQVAGSERTYARIEDGAWECETLVHVEGLSPSHRRSAPLREETKYTEIFFTNDAAEVILFVTLSGEVECDEIADDNPAGYLYTMSDGTRRELTNDARLARFISAESYLEFCGYCGRDNSLIGAGFGVVFTLLGAGMIFFGRNMRRV